MALFTAYLEPECPVTATRKQPESQTLLPKAHIAAATMQTLSHAHGKRSKRVRVRIKLGRQSRHWEQRLLLKANIPRNLESKPHFRGEVRNQER